MLSATIRVTKRVKPLPAEGGTSLFEATGCLRGVFQPH
jgi:hypothetical protein